eukprot:NODE_176_length_15869_cov_0.275777.p1 type:complete len:824 gc:universal NODE_176_length_15869_cov_0.275777:2498-4969(+)
MLLVYILFAKLKVQTQLLQGYGSSNIPTVFDTYTGVRVVFTPDEKYIGNSFVFQPIESDMDIIMDVGRQKLENITLLANQNYTLTFNPSRRISFLVRTYSLSMMDSYYYTTDRYLLHLDMDIIQKLKNMEPAQVIQSHPKFSPFLASQIVSFFKSVFSGSIFTHADDGENLVIFNTTKTEVSTHLRKRDHESYYSGRTIELPSFSRLFKRDNLFYPQLSEFLGNSTISRAGIKLSKVFSFISNAMGAIGFYTIKIIPFLRDLFHWEHVGYVQHVMSHLCTIIKEGILESLDFVDMKIFEHYVNERKVNSGRMEKHQMEILEKDNFNTTVAHKDRPVKLNPYLDARSSFIDDLYMQNVANAKMDNSTKLDKVNKEAANLSVQFFEEVQKHVNMTSTGVKFISTQFLEVFTNPTHSSMSMTQKVRHIWLVLSSKIVDISLILVSKLFEALMVIFKKFINLYWTITHTKLHIPLLSDFLSSVLGIKEPTMLSGWSSLGAMMFTHTFKFHKDKFPINRRDMNILTNVNSPYLIVWAWEHDPIAGPPSKDGYYKKSCIIDWMIKALTMCARLFAYSLSRVAKRQVGIFLYLRQKVAMNQLGNLEQVNIEKSFKRNILPYTWGAINVLFSFSNYMSANLRFPFDYLKENDPVQIREQMKRPDRKRWMYWMIRYPRTLFYLARPFLEDRFRKTNPFMLELFKFLVNGLLKLFVLPFNIYQLHREIDINDHRRYILWSLTSSYWMLSMFGDVSDVVLAYFHSAYYKTSDKLNSVPAFFKPLAMPNSAVAAAISNFNDYADLVSNIFCLLRFHSYIGFGMSGWYSKILDVDF